MKELTLHFDGSCEPVNPGGVATFGWVVTGAAASGSGVACEGPGATNNVAEWTALGHGLRYLVDAAGGAYRLAIRGDSKLVICQLTGAWQCNAPRLIKLRDRCRELLGGLEACGVEWEAQWVPRDQNAEADRLSRIAYELHTGHAYPERQRRGKSA